MNLLRNLLSTACFSSVLSTASAQEVIPLYKDSVPNATGYVMQERTSGPADNPATYRKVSVPTATLYLPAKEKQTGSAVIIFPGGSYTFLAFRSEGVTTAKALAEEGITVFLVKYRLPSDSIMRDKTIGPLQDAQAAVKLVRMRAQEWGIDTNRIGVMGFSAGGHLVATLGNQFATSYIPNKENTSLRPDFMALIYPVISMEDALAEKGSRTNLLGKNLTPELIHRFSGEQQVTDQTPPAYITHTEDDRTVNVENSIIYYQALKQHKVRVEMHLYATGDHGFVLNMPVKEWLAPLLLWMQKGGWLKKAVQ